MGDWDAVIDVSNVCWSPALPPMRKRRAYWSRLGLVMAAWRREHGDDARLHLVADASLRRVIDSPEDLQRLKDSGELLTATVADGVILDLARENGLHVITHDHYVDHRDTYRWIEQFPERFHRWETVDGDVRIIPLDITPRSAQDISMARELKDLRRTRLDTRNPEHRRILHTRWKCANTSCSQAATWQGQLLVWPVLSLSGEAMCPACDRPLEALGPRAQLFEVVVAERASQAEIMRFPLEADVPVIVGRGTVKGIDLSPTALSLLPGLSHQVPESFHDAVGRVSRLHLLMRIEAVGDINWRLAVIDLDSRNHTEVERWQGSGFLPSRDVPPDKETYLSAKDRLILAGTVQLRLSGKRYPHPPTASFGVPPERAEPAPSGPATMPATTITDGEGTLKPRTGDALDSEAP
ncbi:MAG TPA: hypothetical protein VMG38_11040 [Trebonia sp.]|nr:hypothetical protein [Trebonia sp.]